MLKKLALLVASGLFSYSANAGLFDSSDFKCGRDDAVKALSDHIRNDALSLLQSDFLTKSQNDDGKLRSTYDKPLSMYQNRLGSISIVIKDVSTEGHGSYGLNCRATILLKIPHETMDVISNKSSFLDSLTGSQGKFNNGSIVWNNVSYSVKLADNNKDILLREFEGTDISSAILSSSILAEDKDKFLKLISDKYLLEKQSAYADADRELNITWKELPDSARKSLKKEQLAWVNDKVKKCGKISDAASETVDVNKRASIYQCQMKMTKERISYLSGNNG